MSYEHLNKIFYKNPSAYEQIYRERFNSPITKHFDFQIKQFNRKNEFPMFLCYTEDLVLLIEKIYKKYEDFLRIIKDIPPIMLNQFELSCIIDEVTSSNEIEGIHSSKREIADILNGFSESVRFSSIVKKYQALLSNQRFQFKTSEDIRKIYDDFAHEEIFKNNPQYKLDGAIFRKESVDIVSGTGKTLHRGMYPESKIISTMNFALDVLNNENIPFLVRLPIFHYLFGYIHPFYDGNGRTARFVTAYFLSEHFHYLLALRLSLTIKRHRKKYYELFTETDSEINRGDITPFVLGFCEIIADTFDGIYSLLNRKMAQLLKYQEKLKSLIPADELTQKIYQVLLQCSLFFPQGVSMEDLMTWTGKSRNTIKARLKSIPKGDIITLTIKKKLVYILNFSIFLR